MSLSRVDGLGLTGILMDSGKRLGWWSNNISYIEPLQGLSLRRFAEVAIRVLWCGTTNVPALIGLTGVCYFIPGAGRGSMITKDASTQFFAWYRYGLPTE